MRHQSCRRSVQDAAPRARSLHRYPRSDRAQTAHRGALGGTDGRGRARLHVRRCRPDPLSHGRSPPATRRARRTRIRRSAGRAHPRVGPPQPLQASDAAHREAQPPHRRTRLPLSARLGSGLTVDAGGAEPAETLSTRRSPQPQWAGDPSAARGPSASSAPLRLGLGYSFALTAAAFFGVGGIIAKAAFNSGVQPSILAEWRVLFAFLVFISIFAALRFDLRIRRADLPLFVVFGVIGLAGVSLIYYEAIKRIPIGVALVIEYTGPVLLLIYARLRGRAVGRRLWVAAALAVLGCFFAAGAYDARLRELNALGLALAATNAFIFALYFALGERLGKTYGTPTLLVWGFGFALVGWSVVRPPWLLPWAETSADGYVQIAAVVVIATVIPFALTLAAVRLIPAARVGLASTFEPVVAAVAAWVALGEHLDPLQIAGGVIVLVGIGIAQSLRPTTGSV
ncbi:MAG: hypothetical protein E6I66_02505 [Chloroflexi bacterium]|nr:MAG: hypothetical protein E6I66_02505 [Chloroflexota bacterium]